MTDGYYELNVGDAEIFRYDSGACSLLGWPPPSAPSGFAHSVDYQVARLFHDFAEILPSVLAEVPSDVAALLESTESQNTWERLVRDQDWAHADDRSESLLWVDHRTLDSAYLRAGPQISFWRCGEIIRVRCDNRSRLIDGVQVWASDLVEAELSVDRFTAEIGRFGDDLLTRMNDRVEAVEAGWKRDGVKLDAAELRQQHQDSEKLWTNALASPPRNTDWDVVRRAM